MAINYKHVTFTARPKQIDSFRIDVIRHVDMSILRESNEGKGLFGWNRSYDAILKLETDEDHQIAVFEGPQTVEERVATMDEWSVYDIKSGICTVVSPITYTSENRNALGTRISNIAKRCGVEINSGWNETKVGGRHLFSVNATFSGNIENVIDVYKKFEGNGIVPIESLDLEFTYK